MTQPIDANDLLMGGGVKSVKWADQQIGHTVIGTIVDQPKAEQMKKYKSTELDFWKSGDPKMQIVVTIQTDERTDADDDGRRRLFIEPRMMPPVREAVLKVGAKGLAVGGRIALRWISGSGEGEGNARQFAAEYAAPAIDPGGLLAGGNGNGHQAVQQAPMLTTPAQSAVQASVLGQPAAGSLLAGAPAANDDAPPGVDAATWAALPDVQRQAVKAAMSIPF